jgi:hypothetical protein
MGFDYKNDAFIRHFLPLWAVQKEKFGLFRQPLFFMGTLANGKTSIENANMLF